MPSNIASPPNRLLPPFPVPFSRPLCVTDYLSALSLCCTYAREAATDGRSLAAHHLFQGAIGYFDCARQLAARRPQNSLAPQHNADAVLIAARAELDDCAREIYSDIFCLSPLTPKHRDGLP